MRTHGYFIDNIRALRDAGITPRDQIMECIEVAGSIEDTDLIQQLVDFDTAVMSGKFIKQKRKLIHPLDKLWSIACYCANNISNVEAISLHCFGVGTKKAKTLYWLYQDLEDCFDRLHGLNVQREEYSPGIRLPKWER